MSAEKPNEGQAQGEADAPAEGVATGRAEVVVAAGGGGKDEPEEKRLRVIVQVEVRAQIDEVVGGKKLPPNLSKISVVSEQQLIGGIRIVGGGD
jgi:hypothetical protein